MARLTLRPHNHLFTSSSSPIHAHNQPFLSLYTIFPHRNYHNPLLKSRVKCSASGTERVRESKKLPPKNPIEDPKPQLTVPSSDSEILSTETGLEQNWPPWKNVPQRYKLIGATSLAFVICNMDKVNLSIAIIPMSHQFGWSSSVAGLVQSSFFWGYALSQLPGGWLSKIFGGRKVLEIGVFTWSFATALVPLLAGFMPGLIFSRILVGIGEGVSPSAATDLIARTIPVKERSRAVGFVFGGLSLGSVLGLLLAPPIIETFNWESVFYLFGLLGVGWFVGFQFLNKEEVSYEGNEISTSHKSENTTQEEMGNSLKEIPWKSFFQSSAVWAMIYTHFCGSWGHYTCLSWLPTYFSEALDLNLTEAAWVSILPPLASIVVTSLASQFADYLITNGVETTTVRKICQTIAFVSPAICMTLSSVDIGLPPWEIVGILTAGLALSSFALSGLYCTHQDISPEYASILLGLTNTVGAVPGIVGVALTGFLLDSTHSWTMSLFVPSIFFYVTGTIVWLAFASSEPQTFTKEDS
ncbi:PREDICTED: probable anion transporter 6, chloroplastic [Camelina sativa]|uniref:Probable anion transporter 6, chloroplastic n=1 Tax=Camelina sativa TaxID=90675 RepID=A0ABM0VCZ4_CAMSA|nr:PREDICTED: probable anion transporter 6, chloroplastic [Camelina sativa]